MFSYFSIYLKEETPSPLAFLLGSKDFALPPVNSSNLYKIFHYPYNFLFNNFKAFFIVR